MPKFKLIAGRHITGKTEQDRKIYRIGDVVESDRDLVERFGKDKFQRVGDDAVATVVNGEARAELEAMSVRDLRELAEADEVELGNATRKNEIIRVLLEARA